MADSRLIALSPVQNSAVSAAVALLKPLPFLFAFLLCCLVSGCLFCSLVLPPISTTVLLLWSCLIDGSPHRSSSKMAWGMVWGLWAASAAFCIHVIRAFSVTQHHSKCCPSCCSECSSARVPSSPRTNAWPLIMFQRSSCSNSARKYDRCDVIRH